MLERIADGRTDLVFDYLSEGRPADSTDPQGVSLIKWCAYYGDVSAIRFLLANGESLSSLGENLDLNGACFHGHWRLCQFLIENGSDVNHPLPDSGEMPLHAATCKDNRPAYDHVIRLLLAAGADPNRVTNPSVETGCLIMVYLLSRVRLSQVGWRKDYHCAGMEARILNSCPSL